MNSHALSQDRARALDLLKAGDHRCVLCRGDDTLISDARGVAPLVDWLATGTDLTGYSAADRVVGRAAALLYVAAGVVSVHAVIASESAQTVFAAHGIEFEAETVLAMILNRDHTGMCPMESAVLDIHDPQIALATLTDALAAMRVRAKAAELPPDCA